MRHEVELLRHEDEAKDSNGASELGVGARFSWLEMGVDPASFGLREICYETYLRRHDSYCCSARCV
jgi:hypothetical protein